MSPERYLRTFDILKLLTERNTPLREESSMALRDTLVWIDLEMTGLDPERDCILEIATIVTDSTLTVLAEGPVFAIHQDEARTQ